MSETLLAHADLAAWFAHAFESAAMDLGTQRRFLECSTHAWSVGLVL